MRATNRRNGRIVANELLVAETTWARARGLLGKKALRQGEGMLIRPCKGVHTFFMKFPIDVVFLDRGNRVLATVESLKPQRMTRLLPACSSVLECAAGTVAISGTSPGDQMDIG